MNTISMPTIYVFNPLTSKDPYSGRTAPLTSKRCILYIYSTNTGTEYFKLGIYVYCPFSFSSKCSLFHNSNVFDSCFINILYTECAKIKKKKFRRQKFKTHFNIILVSTFRYHKSSLPFRFLDVFLISSN